MTWKEIQNNLSENTLILPIGSIEQHSLHLPMAVDSIIAERLSELLADNINGIVAPTIVYGANSLPNSGGGMEFIGTVGVTGTVLISYYSEIVLGYIRAGAKKIIVLNAHWENEAFIIESIESVKSRISHDVKIVALSWWSVLNESDVSKIFGYFDSWNVEHAGQAETALMMYFAPQLVREFDNKIQNISFNPNIYISFKNEKISNNFGALSKYSHVTYEMAIQFVEILLLRLTETVGEIIENE